MSNRNAILNAKERRAESPPAIEAWWTLEKEIATQGLPPIERSPPPPPPVLQPLEQELEKPIRWHGGLADTYIFDRLMKQQRPYSSESELDEPQKVTESLSPSTVVCSLPNIEQVPSRSRVIVRSTVSNSQKRWDASMRNKNTWGNSTVITSDERQRWRSEMEDARLVNSQTKNASIRGYITPLQAYDKRKETLRQLKESGLSIALMGRADIERLLSQASLATRGDLGAGQTTVVASKIDWEDTGLTSPIEGPSKSFPGMVIIVQASCRGETCRFPLPEPISFRALERRTATCFNLEVGTARTASAAPASSGLELRLESTSIKILDDEVLAACIATAAVHGGNKVLQVRVHPRRTRLKPALSHER